MWLWRRMEKISWTEKVTNEEVLRKIGEKITLISTIYKPAEEVDWPRFVTPESAKGCH